jgi:IS4 transposase
MSDEEITEGYRQRWAIEILWKFLKMHLKLDRLMTKLERLTQGAATLFNGLLALQAAQPE